MKTKNHSAKALYEHLLENTGSTAFDTENEDQKFLLRIGLAENDNGIFRINCYLGHQTYENAINKQMAINKKGDRE